MGNNLSNYNLLIQKLDDFIRKYYLNQIVRGSLYFTALVLALFLVSNLLEYYLYFGTGVRKLIFYGFVLTSLASLGFWVIMPALKYFRLGQVISHEEAGTIVGKHFTDVQDKLLNILQLNKQAQNSDNKDLILASVEQKTEAINPIPFVSAIDLSGNKKYLKYALPPFLLLIFILFAAPSIIKDSTYRIVNNSQEFEREAPFYFTIANEQMEVLQFEDFELEVEVDGRVLPNEVYVEQDNFLYKMQKKDGNTFAYNFRNVQKNIEFKLVSGKVSGTKSTLKVLEKPSISEFQLGLNYPTYTGRKNETLRNIGDITVPEGTNLEWLFNTRAADMVLIAYESDDAQSLKAISSNSFAAQKRAVNDFNYRVYISNKNLERPDSVSYNISVIKDQFPSIEVEQFVDSLDTNLLYFLGSANDDYGIANLNFNYYIQKESGVKSDLVTQKLAKPEGKSFNYQHSFNIRKLNLEPGDNLFYYFEVKDNDAINGSKSSRTDMISFRKPSYKEFKEMENANDEFIKDNLKDSKSDMEKLQEALQKMREKLLSKKELDWQDKKELEKLLEEQKKAFEKFEEAKQKFDENLNNQEEFKQPDPAIQDKQEKLNEMFNEAIDPERQELMDKIMDLLQELDKEDAIQMVDQFQQNNESMQKQMERLLELYKQLEMEKEVREQIEALNELAEKQEELAKETLNEDKSTEELKDQQEKINEEFEEISEKLKELEEKNKDLSPPKDLGDDNEDKMEDIQKDLDKTQNSLDKGDKGKANKSQKDAAGKMKNMAGSLQSSMEGGDMEQQMEDIKALRQLLENLVNLSFDQETVMEEIKSTPTSAPRYIDLIQRQNKLRGDFVMIEDSLVELSKRVMEIESFVLDKVTEVKYNMDASIELLADRKTARGVENQRRSMTNVNDLALMLSESMKQMQEAAASGMPGAQMCTNPGGKGQSGKSGKVPLDKISEGQEGLNDDMKGMGDKMKQGEKPSSKDFAQAAARQAALRKALQELQKEMQEQGKGSGGLNEIIDEMDRVETQLVNKRLDAEVMKRQQDILTRLLEAEKAERQREMDNKRKSEVADEKKKELPPALQEYLRKREAEVEMYKTTSPELRPYYRTLVDEYHRTLKQEIK
jgi:hypothetical protein